MIKEFGDQDEIHLIKTLFQDLDQGHKYQLDKNDLFIGYQKIYDEVTAE